MTTPPSPVSLGRVTAAPPPPVEVRWVPLGTAAEPSRPAGLTDIACAALFGVDAYRVGYRWSAVGVPPDVPRGLLERQLSDVDPGALRRTLVTRRAVRMNDRGRLVQRALHRVGWGETCVDTGLDAAAAAAITDRQIVEHAHEILDLLDAPARPEGRPDALAWRGGFYYGARDLQRIGVGVQLPWPDGFGGVDSVRLAAVLLGRVGTPGTLVQALARRRVPYYAAATMPVLEHGADCLRIGLSTVADHVATLLDVVRNELHRVLDAGVPDTRVPFLRAGAALHEAVNPSLDPFQCRAERAAGPAGPFTPAVAVVGRPSDAALARLREIVREW
ncbi:hypothetical protein ACFY9Y_14610 [Streptomyces fimicarius]|uniref:hypothetical protein n=1 Tax=Streptomyces griseus TaxID=1911 RepID=UPI0036E7D88D